jgi:hypothetical protein
MRDNEQAVRRFSLRRQPIPVKCELPNLMIARMSYGDYGRSRPSSFPRKQVLSPHRVSERGMLAISTTVFVLWVYAPTTKGMH